MTRLRLLLRRLAAAVRPGRMDEELRDEIAGHIAEATDDYMRRGLSREHARLAALRSFGGVAQTEEIHRDVRSVRWLADFRHDLRHTVRALARTPAFTFIAVLTLALGIGANTTIFTLLDAVVLKPLPLPAPGELVALYENGPEGAPDATGGTGRFLRFSYARFQRLQQALGSRGSLAAVTRNTRMVVRLPQESDRRFLAAQLVSGEYFDTLGIHAARGRLLALDDVRLDRTVPVAVVSDGFWRRSLNASETVLGQTLVINDLPVTVIGVAPPGFVGMWTDSETDVWLPLTLQQPLRYQNNSSSYGAFDPKRSWLTQDTIAWLNLVARIPGDYRAVMPALQAANRNEAIQLANLNSNPKDRAAMAAHTLEAEPLVHGFSGLRARYSTALFTLAGMVAIVLLVTCANVANLLLARGAGRARDIAVRLSLGASTGRLIRQCLTESLVLALLGGAAGVFISRAGSTFLAKQVLGTSGRLPEVFAPDLRVLVFAALISIAAAIAFGLAPAFRAIGAGRHTSLATNQRQAVGGGPLTGMRSLVVGQLALSVALVCAAMLLGRTLMNFMRLDPGFAGAQLMTVSFDPITSGYPVEQLPQLARRLVATSSSIPGVAASAVSSCGLIAGCTSSSSFRIEGAGDESKPLYRNWVTPGYFATTGIPLAAGREFSERDTAGSPRVAIVNETAAKRYLGGTALGRRLGGGTLDTDIVGVVHDARTQSLHDDPVPMVYFPVDQKPVGQPTLTNLDLRIAGSPAAIEPVLRKALRDSEPNLLVGDVSPMSRRLSRDLSREQVVAYLAFGFGGLTLLLAALGLYGVLSYAVALRTQEIGVRMALGASRMEVLALVAGQSARLTILGTTLGLAATFAGSRLLSGMLFGVTALDPATFVLVPAGFAVVAALASFIPARHATSVDPLVALRCE